MRSQSQVSAPPRGNPTTACRAPSPTRRVYIPWQPSAALLDYAPEDRAAIAAVLSRPLGPVGPITPILKRERPLSPREVFDAGRDRLVKLPLSVAALLMADLPGVERPVKNNQIEIGVPEVDPDQPLVFGLSRRNGQGVQDPLRNGEKWLVRINPLDPKVAWLFTADNKFAGVASYYGRIRRDDPAALEAAYKRKAQALSPMLAEARRIAAPISQAAADRAGANAQLLGPAPGSRAARQTAEAKRLAAYEPSIADALYSPPPDLSDVHSGSDFSADALL